jgi:hypothetical protein
MSNKNTIYKQKSDLDQFYTHPGIARWCYDIVQSIYKIEDFDLVLEPCAGTGSFFNLFPENKRDGLDLDPQCAGIKKMDFFNYMPPENKKIIVISNPPFGRIASLAIQFFNKAAEFSSVIAFIVPKTFRKRSLQNKLNLNFHLKFEVDLPKNSFVFNNEAYDVPCVFQVWEKRPRKRIKKVVDLTNDYFEFVKKDEADFAVRRVGGTTGKCKLDLAQAAEVSHYFLKVKSKVKKRLLIQFIDGLDFTRIINSTAGVKSLSKQEFVEEFLKRIKGNPNAIV